MANSVSDVRHLVKDRADGTVRWILAGKTVAGVWRPGFVGRVAEAAGVAVPKLKDNRSVMEGTTLFTRMRRPVMVAAEQTPQYADVRGAGHDGGDFLFVRKK